MRIYWIEDLGLGMMARPRGEGWLESEVKRLKSFEVDWVISLLESEEAFELGLEQEEALCQANGISFSRYPIPDREVPQDHESFLAFVNRVEEVLAKGGKVVIHCRMGIGRTGMLAAAVLRQCQPERMNVFAYLSEVRTLEMPDTPAQVKWIKKHF